MNSNVVSRVLHTRTDVRVDGRSDAEFLVPVSAWNFVTSEIMHGSCYVFAYWGFHANTSLLILSSWIFMTMMVFYLIL